MSDSTGLESMQGQPHLSPPPKDDLRLGEAAVFEHRGSRYQIALTGDDLWSIHGEDGRAMGSLFVLSPVGEEHEPVYGVRRPGEAETYHEGTDWRSLAGAAINAVIDEE